MYTIHHKTKQVISEVVRAQAFHQVAGEKDSWDARVWYDRLRALQRHRQRVNRALRAALKSLYIDTKESIQMRVANEIR
jgi:hypothetical protein